MNALLHTYEAQTSISPRFFKIESRPCISDLKPNIVCRGSQIHGEVIGATIFDGVVQGFLGDSKEAKAEIESPT
jgi:hypothetical protein